MGGMPQQGMSGMPGGLSTGGMPSQGMIGYQQRPF